MTTVAAPKAACYGARVCRGKLVERRRRKAAGLTPHRAAMAAGPPARRRSIAARVRAARDEDRGSSALRRVSLPLSTLWLTEGSDGSVISTRLAATCLTILLAGLAAHAAVAAEYYVAPGGNDGNAGTSPSSAWRTIAKANAAVAPGDTIYLRGGRYVDDPIKPSRSGKAGAEIRYVAYADERP